MGIQTARDAGITYNGVLGSSGGSPNVTVYDADAPLQDLAHSELTGQPISVIPGGRPNLLQETHGQEAAGVIVGKTIGIVPGAKFVSAPTTDEEDGISMPMGYIPSGLTAPTSAAPGDVILLEQAVGTQTTPHHTWSDIPVEGYDVEGTALIKRRIRAATDRGVIVVESAGNGNNAYLSGADQRDADGNPYPEDGTNLDYSPLAHYFDVDSGAIIVGAGVPLTDGFCSATIGMTPRARRSYSTYGSRVDVQGPSDCIVGTANEGGSWRYPLNADEHHAYNYFSGASGASAVVAGVAAAVSSAYKVWSGGTAPTPDALRNALRRTASAQTGSDATTKHIGGLVNLKGAIDDLESAPTTSATGLAVNTSGQPTFTFSSGTSGVTYQCRIIQKRLPTFEDLVRDPLAPYTTCSGPSYTPAAPLPDGEYKLQVRAVKTDSKGVSYDATPAEVPFAQATTVGAPTVKTWTAPTRAAGGQYSLWGSVSANGSSTATAIEYGATTSYGSQLIGLSVSPGTAPKAIGNSTGTLADDTTYHYRTKATNGTGTTYGPDQELGPPIVTAPTGPAGDAPAGAPSWHGGNTYVLHGTVNPHGLATTTAIEFGPTLAYGTSIPSYPVTPGANAGTPSATGNAVSIAIGTGALTPGTTYHYRTVAINASGPMNGPDNTFLATGKPLVTPSSAPTFNPGNVYTLRAVVDPQSLTTTSVIQYGTSDQYGSSISVGSVPAAGGPTVVMQNSAALTPGTTYHYRTVSTNEHGSTTGPDQTFVTAAAPNVTVSTAPVRTSDGTYTLAGNVDPKGLATTTSIEYGATSSYGSTLIAQNVAAGTPQQVTGQTTISTTTPGTAIHYRTVATNGVATTYGPDQAFVPGTPVVTTSTAPLRNANGTYVLYGKVDSSGLTTTVRIEYGTTTSYGSGTNSFPVGASDPPRIDYIGTGTLVPGTTYHYRTVATNSAAVTYGPDQTFVAS
ncbi:MAG: hypothetical protein REI11_10350 [Patulibacter sp.]|nr:hypothetical protein [Patulibacter sp.]